MTPFPIYSNGEWRDFPSLTVFQKNILDDILYILKYSAYKNNISEIYVTSLTRNENNSHGDGKAVDIICYPIYALLYIGFSLYRTGKYNIFFGTNKNNAGMGGKHLHIEHAKNEIKIGYELYLTYFDKKPVILPIKSLKTLIEAYNFNLMDSFFHGLFYKRIQNLFYSISNKKYNNLYITMQEENYPMAESFINRTKTIVKKTIDVGVLIGLIGAIYILKKENKDGR